jgi:type I restriction enzyme S subunit
MASVKDLTSFGVDLSQARLISIDEFKLLVKQGCKPEVGDVLIAKDGNSALDTVCNVDFELDAVMLSSVAILRPNPSLLDAHYLKHYLSSSNVIDYLKSNFISGAAIPRVVLKDFKKAQINLPPLKTQKNIASTLDALDARIALLRETNATLEAIAQGMFKSWFVDFDPVHAKQQGRTPEGIDEATASLFPDSFEESELGLVPSGWSVKRLGDITERITKGTTPTTLKRPFVESGINFVKVESLTENGEFIPEKFAYIDNETHELLKRSQLKVDDVLITIAGTIGRIAVITEDFLPANTNQAVALIRPNAELFPSGLIKHFLQRDDSRQSMGERVVQAVQANLSLGSLSDLMLVVPPAEVVKKLYGAGIAQIDAGKRTNQQKVRTLTSIRDTLLPRLISGQLRLNDTTETLTGT